MTKPGSGKLAQTFHRFRKGGFFRVIGIWVALVCSGGLIETAHSQTPERRSSVSQEAQRFHDIAAALLASDGSQFSWLAYVMLPNLKEMAVLAAYAESELKGPSGLGYDLSRLRNAAELAAKIPDTKVDRNLSELRALREKIFALGDRIVRGDQKALQELRSLDKDVVPRQYMLAISDLVGAFSEILWRTSQRVIDNKALAEDAWRILTAPSLSVARERSAQADEALRPLINQALASLSDPSTLGMFEALGWCEWLSRTVEVRPESFPKQWHTLVDDQVEISMRFDNQRRSLADNDEFQRGAVAARQVLFYGIGRVDTAMLERLHNVCRRTIAELNAVLDGSRPSVRKSDALAAFDAAQNSDFTTRSYPGEFRENALYRPAEWSELKAYTLLNLRRGYVQPVLLQQLIALPDASDLALMAALGKKQTTNALLLGLLADLENTANDWVSQLTSDSDQLKQRRYVEENRGALVRMAAYARYSTDKQFQVRFFRLADDLTMGVGAAAGFRAMAALQRVLKVVEPPAMSEFRRFREGGVAWTSKGSTEVRDVLLVVSQQTLQMSVTQLDQWRNHSKEIRAEYVQEMMERLAARAPADALMPEKGSEVKQSCERYAYTDSSAVPVWREFCRWERQ